MDGQIMMAIYRIEAMVKRVSDVVVELEKFHDDTPNLTDEQKETLKKEISKLKEIQ
jgi:hypothetical protein